MEFVTPKFEQNQIVYIVQQFTPIKCTVSELYIHYTVNGPKIKYVLRAYGLSQPINDIDEERLYATMDDAKKVAINKFKNLYSKERLKKEYKEQLKAITDKYEPRLKDFNTFFKTTIQNIEKVNDEQYDKFEADYQQKINESKKEKSTNEQNS
jgi:hypothetical protein